jgi:DNA-binding MarR family transcriptional regulator
MSRVHHRVLYFVAQNPGLTVGELLGILGISKQGLHGPLRRLVQDGWIESTSPAGNRRQKQLRLTDRGEALEEELSGGQRRRFERVFAQAGPDAETGWRDVMRRLTQDD